MKKTMMIFILVVGLYGYSVEDLAVFNTPLEVKEQPVKKDCWIVCKKKLSKVRELSNAINFYKSSKFYRFSSSKNLSK